MDHDDDDDDTTNTLIVTGLCRDECQSCLEYAQSNLSQFDKDNLTYSTCLASLHRLVFVFSTRDNAKSACESIFKLISKRAKSNIKVSFAQYDTTSTNDSSKKWLKPPSRGKLVFISPPPSPPPGWDHYEEHEEAPNTMGHHYEEEEEEFANELARRLNNNPQEPIQLAESSTGHKILLDYKSD